ncbi:hypothetical protein H6P81_015391 [Aristolochia fimbriata]|uniref:Uncharacterized protein n=1 Tax=Aristolochia fimbriata TaxID=158543 RepID=A0AAV7E6M0_ARIFI|nr:hypothetical protein H6P81_015391 [Aristolochia fimbriata]
MGIVWATRQRRGCGCAMDEIRDDSDDSFSDLVRSEELRDPPITSSEKCDNEERSEAGMLLGLRRRRRHPRGRLLDKDAGPACPRVTDWTTRSGMGSSYPVGPRESVVTWERRHHACGNWLVSGAPGAAHAGDVPRVPGQPGRLAGTVTPVPFTAHVLRPPPPARVPSSSFDRLPPHL